MDDTETFVDNVRFYTKDYSFSRTVTHAWGDYVPFIGSTVIFDGVVYVVERDLLYYTDDRLIQIDFLVRPE